MLQLISDNIIYLEKSTTGEIIFNRNMQEFTNLCLLFRCTRDAASKIAQIGFTQAIRKDVVQKKREVTFTFNLMS